MAAEIGTQTAGLASGLKDTLVGEQLAESPTSFDFFQAVALLQRLRPKSRPVGEFSKPDEEAVHFRANPRLSFPASQIQSLELREDAPPEMMVNFMGLTGPSGVLPLTYSELILERARAKDTSFADFLDIFNNRLVALFYRAWQKSRFPAKYAPAKEPDGEPDRFTGYLMDLVGLGTDGLAGRQEIADEALLHYASLVGMQSRSAAALEQIIGDYFDVPVEVEQFSGCWYTLDRATQCEMSGDESPSVRIGGGAVVGDAIWDRQGRVRVRIGPLTLARYREFLPDGGSHEALRSLVRFFGNGCLDFELQLVLKADEVPLIELDLDAEAPARLGWLSWAKVLPLTSDGEGEGGTVRPEHLVPASADRDETILAL